MKNVKNVVLLGGYSRSGKTSFLSELVKNGVEVVSTSAYLDLVCSSILMHHPFGFEGPKNWSNLYEEFLAGEVRIDDFLVDVLQKKEDKTLAQFAFGFTCRGFKIHIAEYIIVPHQGRYKGLVLPTLAQVNPDKEAFVVATIGGREGEMFETALKEDSRVLKANIRSLHEEKGNDIRELLPVNCDENDEFWFNGTTWHHASELLRLKTRFELMSEFFDWWEYHHHVKTQRELTNKV